MNFQQIHRVDRPREKLAKLGPKRLTNNELLAILLNTGTKDKNVLELATEILDKFRLPDLLNLGSESLSKITGIGQAKASLIVAANELVNRTRPKRTFLTQINEPSDALPLLKSLRNYKKEYLIVLYLNIKNEVIWQETVSMGTVDFTIIHPREIFEPAIRYMASAVLLAHNHPTGDPEPSENDLEATRNLIDTGILMGIPVIDHIIISQDDYRSINDYLGL